VNNEFASIWKEVVVASWRHGLGYGFDVSKLSRYS